MRTGFPINEKHAMTQHRSSWRKKSVNVNIGATLMQRAKALSINLSRTLEERPTEVVRASRQQEWLRKNREAIEEHNRRIERHGVCSARGCDVSEWRNSTSTAIRTRRRARRYLHLLKEVQSELLSGLNTRVVVPLLRASVAGMTAERLNPKFEVEGSSLILSTTDLAGVPTRALGEKAASLQERRSEIIAALDLLFTGI
jgi:toxin CcdB